MAIEKNIRINVDTKGAVKSFDELGDTIQEQKDITIEFEKELSRLEQQLASTSKGNLTQQKQTKDRIVSLKGALKDQRISLKELNNERGKANKVTKLNTESLSRNYGVVQLLDQVTGGLATQVRSVVDANRLFNISLKGTRTALIATGIGAFIVALGLVVAYWDDIKDAISGANEALAAQNELVKQQLATDEKQLAFLKLKRELLVLEGKDTASINILISEKLKLIESENKILIKNLKVKIKEAEAVRVEAVWWKRILLFREGITKNTGSEADKKAQEEKVEALKAELAALEAKNEQIKITQFLEANPKDKTTKTAKNKKIPEILGTADLPTDTDIDDITRKRLEGIEAFRQQVQDVEDFYYLKGIEREISDIERKAAQDVEELERLGAHKDLIAQVEQQAQDKINNIVSEASEERAEATAKAEIEWADLTA